MRRSSSRNTCRQDRLQRYWRKLPYVSTQRAAIRKDIFCGILVLLMGLFGVIIVHCLTRGPFNVSPQMLPMKLQVGIHPKFSARDRSSTKWTVLRGLDITDSPTLGVSASIWKLPQIGVPHVLLNILKSVALELVRIFRVPPTQTLRIASLSPHGSHFDLTWVRESYTLKHIPL